MVEGGQCPEETQPNCVSTRENDRLEKDQMNTNVTKDTYSEGDEHGVGPSSPVGGWWLILGPDVLITSL